MSLDGLTPINNTAFRAPASFGYGRQAQEPLSIYYVNGQTFSDINKELTLEKTPEEDMELIAHRGYSEVAPENTIAAFVAAANNGFDTVECDIQWTKDSIPVILHDSTINRTARHKDGREIFFARKCSSLNYQDLLNFDFGIWKGKQYKGEKIPTFSEFIECCGEYDLKAYVELKQGSGFDSEKAKKLIETLKQAGLEDKITWISFNADYLKTINELMPNCRLGYLSSEKPSDKTIAVLQSLKTDSNEVFLDVKSSAIDKNSSQMLEDAGFSFEVWTVDDEKELDILQDYDCKGVTTNSLTESIVEKYLDN